MGRELFIWTSEDIAILKSVYSYETKERILQLLPSYSWKTIWSKAYVLGIKRLNSHRNGKPFKRLLDYSTIDTEEKAYTLGFIAADGCIRERPGNRAPGLSVKLALKDEEHVKLLRDIISPDSNITYPRNPNGKQYAEFYIADQKFCDNLIRQGIIPRKTYNPIVPTTVSSKLLHHWVRGYFDGDGCVSTPKTRYTPIINISGYGPPAGPNNILSFIGQRFRRIYPRVQSNIIRHKNGTDSLSYNSRAAEAFINWIYSESSIFLKRKYELSKYYIKD
jgi:hypothetical protein